MDGGEVAGEKDWELGAVVPAYTNAEVEVGSKGRAAAPLPYLEIKPRFDGAQACLLPFTMT